MLFYSPTDFMALADILAEVSALLTCEGSQAILGICHLGLATQKPDVSPIALN